MPFDVRIEELEQMAKFNIPEQEKAEMVKYLGYLTADFEKIAEADTEGIDPLFYGIELSNIFREDVAMQNIPREKLLESAPEHEDGYFKVPRTLE